jgi:hypothetical protein
MQSKKYIISFSIYFAQVYDLKNCMLILVSCCHCDKLLQIYCLQATKKLFSCSSGGKMSKMGLTELQQMLIELALSEHVLMCLPAVNSAFYFLESFLIFFQSISFFVVVVSIVVIHLQEFLIFSRHYHLLVINIANAFNRNISF